MQQSEQINELAEALAKAQGSMQNAKKDSTNPHFKSNYADLAAIVTATRKALADNSLSVMQATQVDDAGNVVLVTTLAHKSGQWVKSFYPVKPLQANPQGFGSALTYARRYSLAALVGMAAEDEDDDGNAATAGSPHVHQFIKDAASPKAPLHTPSDDGLAAYNARKAKFVVDCPILPNGSRDFDLFATDFEVLAATAKSMDELSMYKKANAKTLNAMKEQRPEAFEHIKTLFDTLGKKLA